MLRMSSLTWPWRHDVSRNAPSWANAHGILQCEDQESRRLWSVSTNLSAPRSLENKAHDKLSQSRVQDREPEHLHRLSFSSCSESSILPRSPSMPSHEVWKTFRREAGSAEGLSKFCAPAVVQVVVADRSGKFHWSDYDLCDWSRKWQGTCAWTRARRPRR